MSPSSLVNWGFILNIHRVKIMEILFAAAAALLMPAAANAQSLAEKYQAPEPRTCPSKVDPTDGVISAEQAAQYFTCDQEYERDGNTLYLLSNVSVQIGKGTPYGELAEGDRPSDGDSDGMVYPIRGSLKVYHCSVPSSSTPVSQQCYLTDEPHAKGSCYRTTFGDWHCFMTDLTGSYPTLAPPPDAP